MNAQACRNQLKDICRDKGTHAGLLLACYLRVPVKDKEKHPGERRLLFEAAIKSTRSAGALYEKAYLRRLDDFKKLPSRAEGLFEVKGRLIVGLGGENVLETGISLHHTYGVPIIPGSSLKGLAAHYCDQTWGAANEEFRIKGAKDRDEQGKEFFRQGKHHRVLFGANDDSGHIVFHDAWITPESLKGDGKQGLVLDVMTPHHGDYYAEKKNDKGELLAPTDVDDPNPITFLSVAGAFQVIISCGDESDDGKKWAGLAMQLVTQALTHWGAGGKTAVGYGSMDYEPPAKSPDPLAEFKLWFEAQRFGATNKGQHSELIERLGKLPDVQAGKAFVKTRMKRTDCTDRLWAFLNEER